MSRTKLGARLWAARQRIIDSGVSLVDEKGGDVSIINEYLENKNRVEAHTAFASIHEKIEWSMKNRKPGKIFYDLSLSDYEIYWLESAVKWLRDKTG